MLVALPNRSNWRSFSGKIKIVSDTKANLLHKDGASGNSYLKDVNLDSSLQLDTCYMTIRMWIMIFNYAIMSKDESWSESE